MPGSQQRSSATAAYTRHKAKARARSAGITLAGQEIGALPPVADPLRRKRGDGDFRFFCETYFPHLFSLAWSKDHLRVLAKIERVVKRKETLAVAMPRGSGKTTLCLVAVIWAILSGRHPFVFLVGSTDKQAVTMLENIRSHLGANKLLLADYPEATWPIRCIQHEPRRCAGQRYYGVPTQIGWGIDELVMPTIPGSKSSGAIIRVAGITGSIRGALHTRPDGSQVRPTLVICDDPQTDASARSIVQTDERVSAVNGAISGLAGPGEQTAIIIPCTVIQHEDLADQLLDRKRNPAWSGERTKMVYKWGAATKLWARYGELRGASLAIDGDAREATRFYAVNRKAMDRGTVAGWPARYDPEAGELSALQHAWNIRLKIHDAAFFAEY
ncbi:MAG TPA: hypothetical protein VMZ50_07580, partial [Phycisphaerae bacterium]|nr:hypothetical protein [Phycisphaerae bacterium]